MKTVQCEWCGEEYELTQHYYNRKVREGKPLCCSRSCGLLLSGYRKATEKERAKKEASFHIWKRGYDEGYQQAILDGAK